MSDIKTIEELGRGEIQKFTKNRNTKKVTERDTILTASTTGVITALSRYVNANSEMELWFHAGTENLAGGDALTVKFYKRFGYNNRLVETVNLTSPDVTAGTAEKIDIKPVHADIESYDVYLLEGTVTVAAGGTLDLVMCKKTQGISGSGIVVSAPTIVGNATAAIDDGSSTVTLTHKSEVRNIGLNTVYLAEGSGGAVAATDFPLYPDESITLKAGTFDAICGAGLTSTLAILKVS